MVWGGEKARWPRLPTALVAARVPTVAYAGILMAFNKAELFFFAIQVLAGGGGSGVRHFFHAYQISPSPPPHHTVW